MVYTRWRFFLPAKAGAGGVGVAVCATRRTVGISGRRFRDSYLIHIRSIEVSHAACKYPRSHRCRFHFYFFYNIYQVPGIYVANRCRFFLFFGPCRFIAAFFFAAKRLRRELFCSSMCMGITSAVSDSQKQAWKLPVQANPRMFPTSPRCVYTYDTPVMNSVGAGRGEIVAIWMEMSFGFF